MTGDPHPLSMRGRNYDKAHLAQRAVHAAKKRLQEMFPEEFENLVREERVARGLPPTTQKDAMQALRDRVEELEEILRENALD